MKTPALTAEQLAAMSVLCRRNHSARPGTISSLCGPAGSGKTTLLAELTKHIRCEVVVPTRMAARVLRSKGVQASTYHSVFFSLDDRKKPNGDLKFVPNNEKKGLSPGKLSWADVIVVDEASMVAYWFIEKMATMCRHLILVGDGNQLPPVKDRKYPRGYFNAMEHSAALTAIHRQAEGSAILTAARDVAAGNRIDLSPFEPDVVVPGMKINDLIAELASGDKTWCVVAYHNWMVNSINRRVRHVRGCADEFSPQPGQYLPQQGEFMLCRSNQGEWENGQTVYIEHVNFVPGCITRLMKALNGASVADPELSADIFHHLRPQFEAADEFTGNLVTGRLDLYAYLKTYFPSHPSVKDIEKLMVAAGTSHGAEPAIRLEFAYARTVHKAQGSEFDTVVVIDQKEQVFGMANKEWHDAKNAGDDPAFLMPADEAQRRWVYTAMTRAAKRLVVWPRKIDSVRVVL